MFDLAQLLDVTKIISSDAIPPTQHILLLPVPLRTSLRAAKKKKDLKKIKRKRKKKKKKKEKRKRRKRRNKEVLELKLKKQLRR